jgi:hypothetical protein
MTMVLTAFFASEEAPPFDGMARNHTQTGNAEESLVMICTWAVVKVSRVKRSCETARFRKITK